MAPQPKVSSALNFTIPALVAKGNSLFEVLKNHVSHYPTLYSLAYLTIAIVIINNIFYKRIIKAVQPPNRRFDTNSDNADDDENSDDENDDENNNNNNDNENKNLNNLKAEMNDKIIKVNSKYNKKNKKNKLKNKKNN